MDRKKIFLFISGLITLSILIAASIGVYNFLVWKKPLTLNNSFVLSWGNYSYEDYKDYPEKVKPFLSDSLYNEYFAGTENEQSQYIQLGRMISKKTEVKTTLTKVIEKKKINSTYQIKNQIEQTITSSGTTTTETKTAIITIIKEGDSYLVSNINYK